MMLQHQNKAMNELKSFNYSGPDPECTKLQEEEFTNLVKSDH